MRCNRLTADTISTFPKILPPTIRKGVGPLVLATRKYQLGKVRVPAIPMGPLFGEQADLGSKAFLARMLNSHRDQNVRPVCTNSRSLLTEWRHDVYGEVPE